ncbi:MAG: cation transporting ATPase C-terminal domain-containing protein, partial [Psychromonas sp.]
PITTAQILWINMITAVTLALSLAFERSESGIMSKPPRPSEQGLFSVAILLKMLLVGGLGAFIVYFLFDYYHGHGATVEFARTISVNALVMVELFYLFNCRFLSQSIFVHDFFVGSRPALMASLGVVLLQLAFGYLPLSQRIFGLESIGIKEWLVIIASTLPVLFIVEIEKALQRYLEAKKSDLRSYPKGIK